MSQDNTITITGNTTRDIDMRYTNSGLAVCDLGLALNERRRNEKGEWEDGDPTFVDVTVWGELAENCGQSVPKGTRVTVTGRVKLDTWETDEGDKRSKLKVIADDVAISLRWGIAAFTKTPKGEGANASPFPTTDDREF